MINYRRNNNTLSPAIFFIENNLGQEASHIGAVVRLHARIHVVTEKAKVGIEL